MQFTHPPLPSKNGDIDWDAVSQNYHQYILSPFAPEMVITNRQNRTRNPVLNYIRDLPNQTLAEQEILDLGCGPGNLIPHVSDKISRLSGVDLSQNALNIAEQVATNYRQFTFNGICNDILKMPTDKKFDLIISSNSILPKTRHEVRAIFKQIHLLLKPQGRFIAILPSFDTTIYLRSLWLQHYKSQQFDELQIRQLLDKFNTTKRVDEQNCAYADDGLNSQCYHTPATITSETLQSGLKLIQQPTKVYYPWELAKRFDYGNFPDASEEIWDWFIIAKRDT